jgi:hypothetical protein
MALKKNKRNETSLLLETLDRRFSTYIKKRDSDINGICTCCTCGRRLHYKEIQCGHYISRKNKSTAWNELNANAQCVTCNYNTTTNGYKNIHGEFIDKKYGIGTTVELNRISLLNAKFSKSELEFMIKHYERKIKEISLTPISKLNNPFEI